MARTTAVAVCCCWTSEPSVGERGLHL
uniref:Uncharacterized protein n=1 Tax=Arundo donax TaxID=35708 RepID=A0A0A9GZF5_ARUDO